MDIHWVRVMAFAHATENREKVEGAIKLACAGAGKWTVTQTEGYHKNPILIFEVEIKDAKGIRAIIGGLKGIIAGNGAAGAAAESRADDRLSSSRAQEGVGRLVDDNCVMHLRLDKQAACLGRLEQSSGEDVISVKSKIAAYPATRDRAVAVLEKYLAGL